jgi:hypothetical protein
MSHLLHAAQLVAGLLQLLEGSIQLGLKSLVVSLEHTAAQNSIIIDLCGPQPVSRDAGQQAS